MHFSEANDLLEDICTMMVAHQRQLVTEGRREDFRFENRLVEFMPSAGGAPANPSNFGPGRLGKVWNKAKELGGKAKTAIDNSALSQGLANATQNYQGKAGAAGFLGKYAAKGAWAGAKLAGRGALAAAQGIAGGIGNTLQHGLKAAAIGGLNRLAGKSAADAGANMQSVSKQNQAAFGGPLATPQGQRQFGQQQNWASSHAFDGGEPARISAQSGYGTGAMHPQLALIHNALQQLGHPAFQGPAPGTQQTQGQRRSKAQRRAQRGTAQPFNAQMPANAGGPSAGAGIAPMPPLGATGTGP